MPDLKTVAAKIERLQEILKIYLMAVGGVTTQLGGVTCLLLDVLVDMCGEKYAEASKLIDSISLTVVQSIYLSVIERLEELNDPSVATHNQALARVGSEVELLPHLLFLKSILVDFGIGTQTDCTALTQKLQEIIRALKS